MTGWHLLKLWAGVAAVGIVVVVGLLLWPLVIPEDPDKSVALVNGRLVGQTEGYVWRVEFDKQRIHVASGLIGHAVPITVTADTKIAVNDKLGGLGDIWKGMDVRVSYEMRDGTRVATEVDLGARSGRPRSKSADVIVPAERPAETTAEKSVPEPSPVAVQPPPTTPSPKAPEVRRAESRPPLPPPRPAAPAAAAAQPAPARPTTAPRTAAPPSEGDAADGSAAVDWLIRGSRR